MPPPRACGWTICPAPGRGAAARRSDRHEATASDVASGALLGTFGKGPAMRQFAMVAAVLSVATVLGVLTPAAGTTAAWADGPQHVKSTFSFENPQPAGAFCNFNYGEAATVSLDAIIFAGRETDHIAFTDTHANLDTGFSLTETGDFTVFTTAGQTKTVGIRWHLRNADGQLVLHQAGQVVISAAGEILKVTPDVNPDNAAVICPALGGQPAT
jgi:hypothetical protein